MLDRADGNTRAYASVAGLPTTVMEVRPWPEDDDLPDTGEDLRIYTLGRFSVRLPKGCGRQTPVWDTAQSRVLLKCLLAAPRYHRSREQLIELLWPGCAPDQGRNTLRHALSRLRHALEPATSAQARAHFVGSNRECIWLDVAEEYAPHEQPRLWIDRERFERAAAVALADLDSAPESDNTQHSVERALMLYHGPFLDADLCASWTEPVRARCQNLWAVMLLRLSEFALRAQHFDTAGELLTQLVEAVPDDEEGVARLMLIQAVSGHRGEALRTYDHLCAYLAGVMNMAPVADLGRLAAAIRAGEALDGLLVHLTHGCLSPVGVARCDTRYCH